MSEYRLVKNRTNEEVKDYIEKIMAAGYQASEFYSCVFGFDNDGDYEECDGSPECEVHGTPEDYVTARFIEWLEGETS